MHGDICVSLPILAYLEELILKQTWNNAIISMRGGESPH